MIGGWTPGAGGRSGRLGALAVGVMDGRSGWCYAGKVGTGFTEPTLTAQARARAAAARRLAVRADASRRKGTVFVEPRLVAAVEFREWTRSGTLRAPSFKGLRHRQGPARLHP